MKKHLDKMIWSATMLVALTATVAGGSILTSKNAEPSQQTVVSEQNTDASTDASAPIYAERTATQYVYYYRNHDGWLQKRKWNRTYNKWEWKTWHNVKKLS